MQNGNLIQYVVTRNEPVVASPTIRRRIGGTRTCPTTDTITTSTSTTPTGCNIRSPVDANPPFDRYNYRGAVKKVMGKRTRDAVMSLTTKAESVYPHEGTLVIMAQVGPVGMKRIMIDNGLH